MSEEIVVSQRPPGHLLQIPPADTPYKLIGIDLLGIFPTSSGKQVVNCIHRLFNSIRRYKSCANGRIFLVLRHRAPRAIITDRRTVFQFRLILEINRLCGITHRMSPAYHHPTNGLTERLNKSLSMYTDVEQKNWDADFYL